MKDAAPGEIVLEIVGTAASNAAGYFEGSKKARAKLAGLNVALAQTRDKLARTQLKGTRSSVLLAVKPTAPAAREWFWRFHHFTTSGGRLAVGGKSAQDNEYLVSRHLQDGDLFFHADVPGASVVILKDGALASMAEKEEVAQFSACYSRAWAAGAGAADSYAVGKSAVSKTAHGQYVAKGGFVIRGGREWFRNRRLRLALSVSGGRLVVQPAVLAQATASGVVFVVPGSTSKLETSRLLHKRLGSPQTVPVEAIDAELPGPSGIE